MAIATGYFTDLIKLSDWIERGVVRTRQINQPVLVSYSQPGTTFDPLQFFAHADRAGQEAFFWERADDKFGMAGAGVTLTLSGKGQDRFEQVEQEWRRWLGGAVLSELDRATDHWGAGPALMGGFRFDPGQQPTSQQWQGYSDGQLTLPEVQFVNRAGECFITVNLVVKPSTDAMSEAHRLSLLCAMLTSPVPPTPLTTFKAVQEDVKPASEWKNLVSRAVVQIKAKTFQKVVLAREVRVVADQKIDIFGVLQKLRQSYASATIFAVATGGRCFLGATPERLVQLCEGEVRTIGLAGSAPRGKTEAEDYRLGAELLNSAKNQEEHAIVVRMLRAALEKVGCHVWAETQPHLLKLSNVQHLYTPVLGRLPANSAVGLLKLVELLHPTPALGGFPRQEALEWLRHNEDLERGWYAAPVGWIDSQGEGEFVVAIRSALIEGHQAGLFAGCGIVADSDPHNEYAESCLKLKPMLTALGC